MHFVSELLIGKPSISWWYFSLTSRGRICVVKVRNSRGCLESNYWSPTFFGQECLNEVNSTAQSRNSVNGCELFAFFNHQFEKETAYVLPWECQSSLKLLTRRYTSVQKMGVKEILALKCLSLFSTFVLHRFSISIFALIIL